MKKVKSGFSMVELLFVMAVMAALAAIAIPKLSGASDSAKATALRSDARTFVTSTVPTVTNLNNGEVIIASDSLSNGNTYGGQTLSLSKNVSITMADESSATCPDGYSVEVKDSTFDSKKVTYNSCTDSAPQLVDQ